MLARAALKVERRRGGLNRKAGLQPGVASDVERLLDHLLHAAGEHVLDLTGLNAGTLDDFLLHRAQKFVGMRVLVVALFGVATTDRRAASLDNCDLSASAVLHR